MKNVIENMGAIEPYLNYFESKEKEIQEQRIAIKQMIKLLDKLQNSKEIVISKLHDETSDIVCTIIDNGNTISFEVEKSELFSYIDSKYKIDLKTINTYFEIGIQSFVVSYEELVKDYYISKKSIS